MRDRWTVWMGLGVAFATGCGAKPPPAAATDAPAQGQFLCALNCSGVEKTTTAATEEAGRAALTAMVPEVCNPDDGQYFITCEPPGWAKP